MADLVDEHSPARENSSDISYDEELHGESGARFITPAVGQGNLSAEEEERLQRQRMMTPNIGAKTSVRQPSTALERFRDMDVASMDYEHLHAALAFGYGVMSFFARGRDRSLQTLVNEQHNAIVHSYGKTPKLGEPWHAIPDPASELEEVVGRKVEEILDWLPGIDRATFMYRACPENLSTISQGPGVLRDQGLSTISTAIPGSVLTLSPQPGSSPPTLNPNPVGINSNAPTFIQPSANVVGLGGGLQSATVTLAHMPKTPLLNDPSDAALQAFVNRMLHAT